MPATELGALYSSRNQVLLVKDDPAFDACRGLCVGTAGTASFVNEAGVTVEDYPLQQGYNFLSIRRLLTGGTADDIWALY